MALRLLALHGFGQNAEVFVQKRAKELVRKLKGVAVLHAIDAPHKLPYDETLRGWWLYGPELWDGRAETIQALADMLLQRQSFRPVGLQESLDLVLEEWAKGYDAILGFSQGAILAAALCAELQHRGLPPPKCAVLISGFGTPLPEGVNFPSKPLPVRSLHVWGAEDDHIPAWASQALAKRFEVAKTHAHAGQHFVPQKAADLNIIVDFLKSGGVNGNHVPASLPAAAEKAVSQTGAGRRSCPAVEELRNAFLAYRQGPAPAEMRAAKTASAPAASEPAQTAGYLPEELATPGPGTYERLKARLSAAAAEYSELGPHPPCRTSEDSVQVRLAGGWSDVTLHSGAKAMLLRTASGAWLHAVLPADCKLSWKKVRALHGKGTRMATEEEVAAVTGCLPGAVPPLAAFPEEVTTVADNTLPETINFNCGLKTRSMRMTRKTFEAVQQPSFADIID